MTNLIKRKWLSLMSITVMVAAVCLIGCGSDAAAPTAVNPTVGGDDTSSSGLDIVEWLEKASWKKYDAKIELNGENVTYSIVFHHQNEVSIYDNYNGNEELNYTWGYSSGHKITFFLTDRAIRFSGDTIIVNSYNMLSRLEKYNGEEKIYMNRSHYYDKSPNEEENKREEDFYNVALPKTIKLTSEGLLMTYYTYDSKTGDINDNQTVLFKF